MSCINCPYNELEARHNRGNYQDDYAWCDKVGGKHYGYGWCDEIYEIKPYQTKKSYKKKEKFNKYYRNKKYKDKLKKLCNRQSSNCLYSSYYPVIWKTIQYNYSKNKEIGHKPNARPKRYYRGNHGSKRSVYYKKISNRKVRRYKDDIINGNWHQKIFDYWWTMS